MKWSLGEEAEDFLYQIEDVLKMLQSESGKNTEHRHLEIMAVALLFVLRRLKLFRTLFFLLFGLLIGHLLGHLF